MFGCSVSENDSWRACGECLECCRFEVAETAPVLWPLSIRDAAPNIGQPRFGHSTCWHEPSSSFSRYLPIDRHNEVSSRTFTSRPKLRLTLGELRDIFEIGTERTTLRT
jgi:hypothetical protein